ncbi:MAG: hydroxymethylbilane synthase [Verrucomicrobiae bacterium]|nr:hydroxymethylbilane synthase [Verrucomicrobiae bacterium]
MNSLPDKLILGTRGSDLALTQTRMVEAELRAAGFGGEIEVKVIKTIGDKRPDLKLSEFSQGDQPVVDKGIFTKELEEALLAGEIDAAVHSLKDVPTELADDFRLIATLERAPIEDVLLSREPIQQGLIGDPTGLDRKTVATSSVRRARQLSWLFPGVQVVDIRGNVPTRVRKLLDTPEWDGILLARAGLERLGILPKGLGGETSFDFEGRTVHAAILDPGDFLPAAGQGAVAIEALKSNTGAAAACALINHAPTFARVTAERHFLHRLQAGCQTPVGALTEFEDEGEILAMRVRVFNEDNPSAEPLEAAASGPADEPETLADQLFELIHV